MKRMTALCLAALFALALAGCEAASPAEPSGTAPESGTASPAPADTEPRRNPSSADKDPVLSAPESTGSRYPSEKFPAYEGNEERYAEYPVVWLTYRGDTLEIREDRALAVEVYYSVNTDGAEEAEYRAPEDESEVLLFEAQDGPGTRPVMSLWVEDGRTVLIHGDATAGDETLWGYKGDDGAVGYPPVYLFPDTAYYDSLAGMVTGG